MSTVLINALGVAGVLLLAAAPARAVDASSHILAGPYDGTFDSIEVVNFLGGAGIFYDAGYLGQRTIIANVEAGHVWGGHEVFDRTGLEAPLSPALLVNGTRDPATAPMLGDLDFHATMVGHVLAGTGLTAEGNFSLLGAGMAPLATLWSGAIATKFSTDEENIGKFETEKAAFLVPYRAFFEGATVTDGKPADVINSSWGFDDPAGTDELTVILDALAAANPSVALVNAAGNGSPTAVPGGPGSGYNGITVGALGGSSDPVPYRRPADYSSGAPADFLNPATGVTTQGVRAAVDISAPGDEFGLAYYGGKTGGLSELGSEPPLPTNFYFVFNQSGTSFASPVVAGGVALLKDVSYAGFYSVDTAEARDTRVLKSVIMAGSAPTTGWNNGQHVESGEVRTTQALDYQAGAGLLDLEKSVFIYIGGTTDVPGDSGGSIAEFGWDFGSVALGSSNDYFFDLAFETGLELTVSLNWFVNADFDALTEVASRHSFADLDLEVWLVSGSLFVSRVAESATLYNNTEFLRFGLPQSGAYGLRVTFDNVACDLSGSLSSETYGLAWTVAAVPEPGAWSAIFVGGLVFLVIVRRRAKFVSKRG
jgi:Subtilase family